MSLINKRQMINGFNAIRCYRARLLNTMGAQTPIAVGSWDCGLIVEARFHATSPMLYQIHFYSIQNYNGEEITEIHQRSALIEI